MRETQGLEPYSSNAIAELAGVSVGVLYQYFSNKEALTVALIERETGALLSDIGMIDPETGCAMAMQQLIAACVVRAGSGYLRQDTV